jgi:P27 family predicted phage terminase small subunit
MAKKTVQRGDPTNGTRGPRKTPTALLKLSGAGNDKRRAARSQEPMPIMGIPKIPFHVKPLLDKIAIEHWDAATMVLNRMGVIGDIDAHILARYCIVFSNWYKCQEHASIHGLTYMQMARGGDGVQKATPEAALAVKYSDQLLKIEREFGMTASARASIDVSKTLDKSTSSAGDYFAKNA